MARWSGTYGDPPEPAGPSREPFWGGVLQLNALAEDVGAWIDRTFPDDTLMARGLVLGEETGEVQRCILKANQQVRGGADLWDDQLPHEVVDVLIALLGVCHRADIDINHAVRRRWAEVRERTYPTTPKGSQLVLDDPPTRAQGCSICGPHDGAPCPHARGSSRA